MPILDPVKLDEPACQCGRLMRKAHCPTCGAYSRYGLHRVSKRMNEVTGQDESFAVFRCRGCGRYYDDWEWQNQCHAPRFITKEAIRKEEIMIEAQSEPMQKAFQEMIEMRKRREEREEFRKAMTEEPKKGG